MRVTVRLFARLGATAGRRTFTLEAPDGATVAEIWRLSVVACPGLSEFSRVVSCAVNAEFAKMTTAVQQGDEIAFLPPVSGGVR